MHIFIRTPVRVEVVGDARRPDGQPPAILLVDSVDAMVVRIPTPDAPGGRPELDAVAMACALDLSRQLNELDETLRRVAAEAGLNDTVKIGVSAERSGERSIGAWRYTLELPSGEQVHVPINPLKYDEDVPRATEVVRLAQRQLCGPRPSLR